MKLVPYPKYRASGVEWIGEVPEHWEVVLLKRVCERVALYGANIPGDAYAPEGVRFLRTTDIDDSGQLRSHGVYVDTDLVQDFLLADGDLLFSRSGTIGRSFRYDSQNHPVAAYAGYLVRFVLSDTVSSDYVFYFTKSAAFEDYVNTQVIASTIGNVNGQKYARCPVTVPSREEQGEIVDYLDHETAKVDVLVRKQHTLIERLREKRSALITETVTRGLPPDAARAAGVDPRPPRKPSGIEWLGDIPAHWDVTSLKRVCTRAALYGANVSREKYTTEGVRFLRTTDIDDLGQLRNHGVYIDGDIACDFLLDDGDLLLSRSGTIGRSFRYDSRRHPPASYAGYLVRFVLSDEIDPDYMFYFTKSAAFEDYVNSQVIVSTIGNVNGQRYALCPVTVPSRVEQNKIVDYLNCETSKVDALVAKIETAIERLREYRSALITAAVTGKVDVRSARQPAPAEERPAREAPRP